MPTIIIMPSWERDSHNDLMKHSYIIIDSACTIWSFYGRWTTEVFLGHWHDEVELQPNIMEMFCLTVMMETQHISKTLGCNSTLMRMIAREDFSWSIECVRQEQN
jgi:hypothetical protein